MARLRGPSTGRALLLAALADLAFGEPPNRLHPVAWFGALVAAVERRAPGGSPARQLLYGAGLAAGGVGLAAGLSWAAARVAERGAWARLLADTVLLKSAFSLRMLAGEAARVQRLLEAGDLPAARRALRALVSRDPSGLDERLAAAAAIESVAENLSDSVVAPLLYAVLGGPGAALAYRAVNTLDAMVGYRGQYEYLGKAAARLDDLLNLAPSRLAALLLVATAGLLGFDVRRAWTTAWRDHGRTASPNAGWPMAAMAGALGRRLEKVDHYTLGDGPAPQPADIARALRLYTGAAALALLLALTLECCRGG